VNVCDKSKAQVVAASDCRSTWRQSVRRGVAGQNHAVQHNTRNSFWVSSLCRKGCIGRLPCMSYTCHIQIRDKGMVARIIPDRAHPISVTFIQRCAGWNNADIRTCRRQEAATKRISAYFSPPCPNIIQASSTLFTNDASSFPDRISAILQI